MGKTTYPLRLPNSEYDEVIRNADERGMTIREWLRRAIREKIEREKSSK